MTSRSSTEYDSGLNGNYFKRPVPSWLAVLLGMLAVTAIYVLSACGVGPQTASMQVELEQEFNRIAVLPSAQPTRHVSIARDEPSLGGRVLVQTDYVTTLTFDHIRSHYDRELARNGWEKAAEEKITDWGSDLGGRAVHYRKGDLEATLTYAGERANYEEYGWTYTLGLTWESRPGAKRETQGSGSKLPHEASFGVAAVGVLLWAVVQVRIIARHGPGYFRGRSFANVYWRDLPVLDRWLFWIGAACLGVFIVLFLSV